jgi:hypothetical protein
MKTANFFPFLFAFLFANSLFSQSNINQPLSVNSDGSAPAASAQLDVSATDKGMLVPRMTSAQRTAIAAPATGLLVFDTTAGSFWFYNGSVWADLSAPKVLADADGNTKVQVEKSANEDIIRFDLGGTENMVLLKNASGSPRLELSNSLDNTFIGFNAGVANSTGKDNVASGRAALFSNTTGSSNTALGRQALRDNTTGYSNTAVGTYALNNNTIKSNLVAVGDSALFNNGIGATSGVHATQNTAVGSKALFSNTTGDGNTATGYRSLFSNITGIFNTANGVQALYYNTSGGDNTALGFNALVNNATGSANTAFGRAALAGNTTGDYNTAIGSFAGVGSPNLTNATAIGASARVAASNCLVLGSIAGVNFATESVNVGIGTTSPDIRLQVDGGTDVSLAGGGFIQTGTSGGLNISMDNNEIMARNNGATSTLFLNNDGGDVIIGENGGDVGIGRNPATNDLEVEGTASKSSAGDWLANSDARLKKNISPLNSKEILEKLLALQGVTYEWNDDKTSWKRPEGIQYGFTAQNIQRVFPTLVSQDKQGFLQTAYGTYDAMVVEAMRALNEEIVNLKLENTTQADEIERLKKMEVKLDKITAALATLSGSFGAGMGVELR